MAIQRRTVAQFVTEIRRNIGEPTAGRSHITDANLYLVINQYLQRLPYFCAEAIKAEGRMVADGLLRFDMYRTQWESTTSNADSTLVVTAGSSTVYLPSNYDHYETFYDKTHKKRIHVIDDVARYQSRIDNWKNRVAGPPQYIQILGYTTNTSWVRQATLYPSTETGVTPSITLTGWRIPASVSASTDYVDIDPKYEELVVCGVSAELMRKDDPNYSRFKEEERQLLLGLAMTASSL